MASPATVPGSRRSGPAEGHALACRGLTRRYANRPVLSNVNLDVPAGAFVAIMGRSGSGKSTLIHLLAGLEAADEGTVTVRGVEVTRLDADSRSEHRLRNVGVVFQHFNLLPDLTVAENVALPLRLAHAPLPAREARVKELLKGFGIGELAERFPESLSGGEMQRVAIARALANGPAVVLADEPTANLDEANARNVVGAFRTAAQGGAAVVVASHDEVVQRGAKHVKVLADGILRDVS